MQPQVPAESHAALLPQAVPAALLPLSAHTDVPVLHEVLPVLHALLGVQVRFAVHAVQAPVLHTRLVPHAVPSAIEVDVSWHTGAPLEHESLPVWQGLAGVQLAPSVHETQLAELLQTWLVPQLEPAALLPLSVHTELPLLQLVAPVLQALAG